MRTGQIIAVGVALALAWLLPTAADAEDWPMFQKDAAHSGAYPKGLGKLQVRWALKADERIMASPVLKDGRVFIGTLAGTLYAADARNGAALWQAKLGSRICFAAVCFEDSVAVGTEDGTFVCVEAASGKPRWRFAASAPLWSNPCVSDGRIFFCDNQGVLYALDTTGQLLWKHPLVRNRYALNACHPAAGNGVVYALVNTESDHARGLVCALEAATGRQVWQTYLEPAFTSVFMSVPDTGPTLSDTAVFVQATDGLYALDRATGLVRWRLAGQDAQGTPAFDGQRAYAKQGSAAWAVDVGTGKLLGSCHLDWGLEGMGLSSLVVCDGAMVDMGQGPKISLDNTTTGKQEPLTTWLNVIGDKNMYGERYRWRHYFLQSSPAVADSCLFVGAGDGRLYCFGQQAK